MATNAIQKDIIEYNLCEDGNREFTIFLSALLSGLLIGLLLGPLIMPKLLPFWFSVPCG